MFGGGAKRFAACSKQLGGRCVGHEPAGKDGGSGQHMLAIVQNDQHLSRSQIIEDRSQAVIRIAPDAQRRHQRRAEKRRVGDRREVDEARAVAALRGKGPRRRDGDCRLADPSCAGQGDVPLLDQQIGNVRHVSFAPDDAAQQWRPGQGQRFGKRQIVIDLGDAGLHIRDEFVAPAGHGRDVDGLDLRIAKRATQARHIDLEIAVMDEDARPGGRHQLILADQFAAALHQKLQKFERASAQSYGSPVEKKQLPARNEAKWAEGKNDFLSACAPLRCLHGNLHRSLPIDPQDRLQLSCTAQLLNRAGRISFWNSAVADISSRRACDENFPGRGSHIVTRSRRRPPAQADVIVICSLRMRHFLPKIDHFGTRQESSIRMTSTPPSASSGSLANHS